jgi:drug/metabolite transporter (DMT)-like permease
MSSLGLGLALAGAASLALNGSYLLQHAGSVRAPAVDARRPLATVVSLLRSRLWATGAAVGIAGWGLHVAALSHAPLSLVQAFVAGTLALIAPIAARMLRQRLQPLEWLAVGIVACALVMLAIGIHDPGVRSRARPAALAAFVAISLVCAASLAFAARSWRAHALGLGGGILYGAADTAIKALTGTASTHVAGVVTSPWLAAAAITTIGAFFAFQRGLQTGRAVPVVVLMTGGTTVVSVCGGFVVFGDPLGGTPLLAALHVAGFALVSVGAAVLAPAAHPPDVTTPDDASTLLASPA